MLDNTLSTSKNKLSTYILQRPGEALNVLDMVLDAADIVSRGDGALRERAILRT
jgi:hypothetical protein